MTRAPSADDVRRLHDELRHVRCVELARWLAEGRPLTILDVRTEREWRSHRLPGSVLVPLHELAPRLPEVLALSGPLVVHCEHGIRSVEAAVGLMWHGRRDVWNLVEGLAAWQGPLEHGDPS